ncbi:hypothetical protein dqs_3207 [Azoarcus olearius]|uniref:hypothetical protein n=1 Tax=Azoarcus sp. (strain BH72) TaxID=418699 RepID=UPI0008060BB6|nr:hypothetical protein [Azoarcus olearius]ANQ86235.1 hypothetical protein dqs_3207 [Azoarcus olearius]
MSHAHIAVASPLGLNVQASGRVIASFAWQHMKAATTFRDQVASLEAANFGREFGPFFEDIRSYGSGCIMSAAASIEAHINECFIDPHGPLRKKLPDFESQFWGRRGIEWKPPLEKYQIALEMLGQPKLDEQAQPFKDAWALVELRNALVHYKPTWDPDRQRTVDMIEVLSGKYELSPFPDAGADFVTMRSMSAAATRWVVVTALRFMKEFHQRTCQYESKFAGFSCLDA